MLYTHLGFGCVMSMNKDSSHTQTPGLYLKVFPTRCDWDGCELITIDLESHCPYCNYAFKINSIHSSLMVMVWKSETHP